MKQCALIFCVILSVLLCSCTTQQVAKKPTYAEKTLQKTTFEAILGWQDDDFVEVFPAFLRSCEVIQKRKAWSPICQKARLVNAYDSVAIKAFFEKELTPWQILLTDGTTTGLATGYYEPLLKGARQKGGPYQTPLHRAPKNLKKPYYTRKDIREKNPLSGYEIVWVDDAVDAFFLQIQGSGRVYLPKTNETIRVAYAGQNGRSYTSIGRYLIDQGEMTLEEASAQKIKEWLIFHPNEQDAVMDTNESYVFFKEEAIPDASVGPKGALGVPLTPLRSVAVDKSNIDLGTPLFMSTINPNTNEPIRKMVMAQDTGGAIKGAIRLDYFCGFGDQAMELAGNMKQPVQIWILQPKN